MFPFKLCTLSSPLPHSLIHPDTHIHTHTHTHPPPPKKCCIFESSSGTISWCQPCVVWSDSHALWGGVDGWMDAQSTIALINTNSYARCIQVSISSQCCFCFFCFFSSHKWWVCSSVKLVASTFDNLAIHRFHFHQGISPFYRQRGNRKMDSSQTAGERSRDRSVLRNTRT